MFFFAQFEKRGNALNKSPLWRWAAPLLNIAEIPIGNSKMLGGVPEIQLGLFSSCTDKSPKGHVAPPLVVGSLGCEHLTYIIVSTDVLCKG